MAILAQLGHVYKLLNHWRTRRAVSTDNERRNNGRMSRPGKPCNGQVWIQRTRKNSSRAYCLYISFKASYWRESKNMLLSEYEIILWKLGGTVSFPTVFTFGSRT